jgi:hypothetical protein
MLGVSQRALCVSYTVLCNKSPPNYHLQITCMCFPTQFLRAGNLRAA